MKNYYKVLEVNENASQEIIEKAYKVLAKKYHPDTQSKENSYWAENNFRQITEAYDILSNPEKREQYNQDFGFGKTEGDFYSKYNNLYTEKQTLEQELNKFKIEKKSEEYLNKKQQNNSSNYLSFFSESFKSLKDIITNESKKTKDEKMQTFKAIGLTAIIISTLLLIAFLIPPVRTYLFPF